MMAFFPMISERHQLSLDDRQYYQGQESLHGMHMSESQWHHYSNKHSTPGHQNPNVMMAPDSLLSSSFCWNPQAVSGASVGTAQGWHHQPSEVSSSFRTVHQSINSNVHSHSRVPSPPDYPESSQRTSIPTTPPIIGTQYTSSHSSPRSTSSYNCEVSCSSVSDVSEFNENAPCQWSSATLYTIDEHDAEQDSTTSHHSARGPATHGVSLDTSAHEASSSPSPDVQTPSAVKVEPEDADDCFIMELANLPDTTLLSQSLAPPTEVPLRATQASPKMRGMMTVFRINPFALHSSGRGAVPLSSWYPMEAGPLTEEPLMFEFQLELDDDESEVELYDEGEVSGEGNDRTERGNQDVKGGGEVRCVAYGVEGQDDNVISAEEGFMEATFTAGSDCQWSKYGGGSQNLYEVAQSHQTPTWELEHPPGRIEEFAVCTSGSVAPDMPSRRSSRHGTSSHHPYARRSTPSDEEEIPLTGRINPGERHRMRLRKPPSEPCWPETQACGMYITDGGASAVSSRYHSNSVGSLEQQCETLAGLPSLSAVARRWSVHSANPQAAFVM